MSEKPKRPMTAYMLWFMSVREQIKAEDPARRVTEIARRAGEIWRAMKDKTVWEAKAVKAKEQYARDMALYKAKRDRGDGSKGRRASPYKYRRDNDESDEDTD